MKLDHRVRMSQRMIRRAFLDLLKKKPVQNITVKEVCEEAGIHRGTFYAHYKDLYDLLHQIEDEMTKNLESALEPLLSCANTDQCFSVYRKMPISVLPFWEITEKKSLFASFWRLDENIASKPIPNIIRMPALLKLNIFMFLSAPAVSV